MLDRRLSTALLLLLAACSRNREEVTQAEAAQAAVTQIAATQAAATQAATSAVVPVAQLGTSPAAVGPTTGARRLPGTGIAVALPKGAKRVARQLTYQVASEGNLLIHLAHQAAHHPARELVERAAFVLGGKQEFTPGGDPVVVSQTPERVALYGTTPEDLLGNLLDTPLQSVIAARAEAGHALFMQASFAEPARAQVEATVASLDYVPTDVLEPLRVQGVELSIAQGYSLRPNQLHPIVVLPAGETLEEGKPSLDVRLGAPGKTQELLNEILVVFRSPDGATDCSAVETVDVLEPGLDYSRQTCRFESPRRGGYRVRLEILDDALGGAVAILSSPLSGGEAETAAYEKMLSTLKLRQPPEL